MEAGDGGATLAGCGSNDWLAGGTGNDVLDGGGLDDVLVGDSGDDDLIGGSGDDLLIGGEGSDTANFGGSFANYTVSSSGDELIVTDNVGADGVDRLSGIETISFSDISATFANGTFQPIVVGENASLLEDGSVSFSSSTLLANDTDIDGGKLSVTGADGAENGSVNFSDGTVTYTPNPNFSGADSFTYTISDGQGGTATATVALEVTAVNDAPVGQDSSAGGNEDAPIDGVVSATDVDGDTLNYSVGSGPSNGSVTLNKNGSYVYTPNSNYHGVDAFTYVATDGKGGEATGTVTLTVAALNDAPLVGAVSVTLGEDDATSGNLIASDVDRDELTFALRSAASNGTAVVNGDGSYTYTPNANYAGSDSFTYTVSDGQGGTTTGTVSVSVSAVNDGPTTPGATALVDEDETFSSTLTAVDVDGDTLSFALSSGASNGTAVVKDDGSYTYTPNTAYTGSDSFTYTVSDGNGGVTTGTVSVTVANVNDAPVTPGLDATTDEDTAVAGTLSATDEEGDSLSFALAGDPAHGDATVNADGSYSYTPHENYNGLDSFTYTVSDGNGGVSTGTVSVTVRSVNDGGPTATADDGGTVLEDGSITISAASLTKNDTDPDDDNLEVTSVGDAVNGVVVMSGDTITFTPTSDYSGPASFTYTVSDGQGGTDTGTVALAVDGIADSPILSTEVAVGEPGTSISLGINAVLGDIDGSEKLSVEVSGVPSGASLSAGKDLGGGVWTLTSAQLANLSINVPGAVDTGFQLGVRASSSETVSGDSASVTTTLPVILAPAGVSLPVESSAVQFGSSETTALLAQLAQI